MPNDGIDHPQQQQQVPAHGQKDDMASLREAMMADPKHMASVKDLIPKFGTKEEEREYLKHRLAQAFRIFAHLGYDEGVAGHITLRDPVDPHTFWVNPFGRHFSRIRAQDLLHVDHSGTILPDSGPERFLNKAAFMIHSEVHKQQPNVNCAAHSHSIYGRAFSTLGIELDITTQDSCAFYKDHVVYTAFRGVVLDEAEAMAIAECLGSKKAAILQNHGLLVATDSIEATTFFYKSLERCCQVQLLADAAAQGRGTRTKRIDDADAQNTFRTVGSLGGGFFSGLPEFQALEAREALLPAEMRFDAPKYWKRSSD